VRGAILGHVQQGGNPSPFDRIQATRLASMSTRYLIEQAGSDDPRDAFFGFREGELRFTPLTEFPAMIEEGVRRPVEQSWMTLRPIEQLMARPPS
jgi:6-phosphofructokinase 1